MLTDAEKLRLLADWFDVEHLRHPNWTSTDVQSDLRALADKLDERDKCERCLLMKHHRELEGEE